VAAIRRPPVAAPLAPAAAGDTVSAKLDLAVGHWVLETPYTSPLPVQVTAPGLSLTLPANLDRPGPRLPIGRIKVTRGGILPISFRVEETLLSPATDVANFNQVVATPAGDGVRIVPLAAACGRYVDWYRGR
jgi:hypothetical protein